MSLYCIHRGAHRKGRGQSEAVYKYMYGDRRLAKTSHFCTYLHNFLHLFKMYYFLTAILLIKVLVIAPLVAMKLDTECQHLHRLCLQTMGIIHILGTAHMSYSDWMVFFWNLVLYQQAWSQNLCICQYQMIKDAWLLSAFLTPVASIFSQVTSWYYQCALYQNVIYFCLRTGSTICNEVQPWGALQPNLY